MALSRRDVETALSNHAHLLQVKLGDKVEQGLVKDVQYDYLGRDVVHLDLHRVDLSQRITYTVSIATRGTPRAIASGSGTLDTPLHELEIECLPTSIPDSIEVMIGDLEIGDSIRVADLELPEGVVALTGGDQLVVSISERTEEAEPEEGEGAGPAEPELIGRKEEEGDEE